MKISTKNKITIARWLSRIIIKVRSLFGLSPIAKVSRHGARWCLDLKEGIDLGIFLSVYEPETIKAFQKLVNSGDCVLDIGANIGAMTLPLAQRVGNRGKVIAFEPTAWAYEKLQRNLALNPNLLPRVKTEQIMLLEANEKPPASVYSSWDLMAGGSQSAVIHPLHQGKLMTTDGVRGISLDEYFDNNPVDKIDLIKLDVDGYELTVLKGARQTLIRYRPKIIFELALYVQEERQQLEALLLELQNAHYRLEQLNSSKVIPMNKEYLENLCHEKGGINLLAIPQLLS